MSVSVKKTCPTCNYFHLYSKQTTKLGTGCCNNIDANPVFNEKKFNSFHPWRIHPESTKSCSSWEEKNEERKAVQVEAGAEGKQAETLPEKPGEVQEQMEESKEEGNN